MPAFHFNMSVLTLTHFNNKIDIDGEVYLYLGNESICFIFNANKQAGYIEYICFANY